MFKSNKRKSHFTLIYDLTFCALALIAVYIALCDLTSGCPDWLIKTDSVITAVFIVDYAVRLIIAKDKKKFFKQNIFDLIAIIPFTSLFKVFRVFKLFKVLKALKIFKMARLSAYFARFYKRVRFFFEINGLKYMVLASLFCIIAGGVAIHFVEDMSVFDGIWWSFVTTTTVGYGDISPATPAGRCIAAVLMIVGIGLIGSLTSTITALFFQRHDKQKDAISSKQKLIKSLQAQLDDFDNLTDDDIETICKTLKILHEQDDKGQ